MIRKGLYAAYNERDYECYETENGGVKLISYDKGDVANGFIPYNDTTFTKEVPRDAVEEAACVLHSVARPARKAGASRRLEADSRICQLGAVARRRVAAASAQDARDESECSSERRHRVQNVQRTHACTRKRECGSEAGATQGGDLGPALAILQNC